MNLSRFLVALTLGLLVCSEQQGHAQWSLTQLNTPVAEDFAGFTAPSTWGTATPAANQLDSDVWAFSQTSATSSASSTFGLNYINGRGISTGGVSMTDVYALDTGSGVVGIGVQADDDEWTPGHLTVKLRNDTGLDIERFRVEWDFLGYNDQSGRMASQLLISPTDATGTYLAPFGGSFITQDAAQVSPSWLESSRDVTINALVAPGGEYYLRWSFDDLTGAAGVGVNRDELGIGNLRITPLGTLAGDYNSDGTVDAADYTVWRDNLNQSDAALNGNGTGDASGLVVQADYDLWVINFGETIGGSPVAIPEPATCVPLACLGGLGLLRWPAKTR